MPRRRGTPWDAPSIVHLVDAVALAEILGVCLAEQAHMVADTAVVALLALLDRLR